MPETLQPTFSPQRSSPEVALRNPGDATSTGTTAIAAWMLGPPNAVASQLVWAGQPFAGALLTGFLAIVALAWFWRVRPGHA